VRLRPTRTKKTTYSPATPVPAFGGRADLFGGSGRDLLTSIVNKLLVLDDSTVVLPGHGNSTTIGAERRLNPFIEGL